LQCGNEKEMRNKRASIGDLQTPMPGLN